MVNWIFQMLSISAFPVHLFTHKHLTSNLCLKCFMENKKQILTSSEYIYIYIYKATADKSTETYH